MILRRIKMISVLMSVYNEEETWISMAVESILKQTYSDLELIIVVDNPENENLINFVSYLSRLDKRVKKIVNTENLGLAKSLNRAFKYAKGNLVARMDSDDISHLNRFETQLLYLKNNPEVDLLSSNANLIDEFGNRIKTIKNEEIKGDDYLRKLNKSNFVFHPSWIMKREVFEKLSGYRPFQTSQDYDFLLRASDLGFELAVQGKVLIDYRVRKKSITGSKGLKQMRNGEYIIELHKQRLLMGVDNFSEKELSRRMAISEEDQEKFNDSLFVIQNTKKNIKNWPKLIKYGFFHSQYFRERTINRIKSRLWNR